MKEQNVSSVISFQSSRDVVVYWEHFLQLNPRKATLPLLSSEESNRAGIQKYSRKSKRGSFMKSDYLWWEILCKNWLVGKIVSWIWSSYWTISWKKIPKSFTTIRRRYLNFLASLTKKSPLFWKLLTKETPKLRHISSPKCLLTCKMRPYVTRESINCISRSSNKNTSKKRRKWKSTR